MGLFGKLKSLFSPGLGNVDGIPDDAHPIGAAELDRTPGDAERGARLARAIGLKTWGDAFTPLLEKGLRLPTANTETFSTAVANQEQIPLDLKKGAAESGGKSDPLALAVICDIPPANAGVPQIAVTVAVDENGNGWIWARDTLRKGKPVPVVGLDSYCDRLDDERRRAFALRVGSFETARNEDAFSGVTLSESVGIVLHSYQFNGETVLPAIAFEALRIPAERAARKAKVTVRIHGGMEGMRHGQDPVVKNFVLDVPGKATLIKTQHYIDRSGVYWFWAKDWATGEDLTAREEA